MELLKSLAKDNAYNLINKYDYVILNLQLIHFLLIGIVFRINFCKIANCDIWANNQ